MYGIIKEDSIQNSITPFLLAQNRELNSLLYGIPVCVIRYRSYKLFAILYSVGIRTILSSNCLDV